MRIQLHICSISSIYTPTPAKQISAKLNNQDFSISVLVGPCQVVHYLDSTSNNYSGFSFLITWHFIPHYQLQRKCKLWKCKMRKFKNITVNFKRHKELNLGFAVLTYFCENIIHVQDVGTLSNYAN